MEEMKKVCAAIVAHVDAGKTTLAEALLFANGAIREKGRVDHGNTHLDSDAIERERGITIWSSGASFVNGNTKITLLDTPGHVDFSSEAERVFFAADIVIAVISASDGVQSHTRTLWKTAKKYSLPVFIFVTKCDLGRRSKDEIMSELRKEFGNCVDPGFENGSFANAENIAECSEELLDEYAALGTVTEKSVASAIENRRLFPVFFGSGLKGDGVAEFSEALSVLSPSPQYSEAFGARIYKITREKNERLTHLKITGGTLKVKDLIKLGDSEEKVDQIRFYNGSKFVVADQASAGDICAVTGFSSSFAGELIGEALPSPRSLIEPVMRYTLTLPAGVTVQSFLPKLRALEEEDPNLRIEPCGASSVSVSLMGAVQAEILKRVIFERLGVEVTLGSGKVIYKETIRGRAEGAGHYEPLRHYAEVHLTLEGLPRGAGVVIGADCPADELETRWQRLIMTHLSEKKHLGVLTGSELTDVRITLTAGKAHLKHTEGGDFRQATYRAVRQALMKAESVLLEPYYDFIIELPTPDVGRAITDVKLMGGDIGSNEINDGGMSTLTGKAPVVSMDSYAATLAAYTGGRGILSLSPGGYSECKNAEKIIEESKYDPESDLENSPDSVFCAHGAGFVVKWNEADSYMHAGKRERAEKSFAKKKNVSIDERELEALMLREFGPIKRREYSEPRVVEAGELHRVKGVRTSFIIIDGYNVIFAWDDLRELAESGDLEGARERLISIVVNYAAFTACRAVIVFDAYRVPGGEGEKYDRNGVNIVFTKENETGDAYIERFVYNVGKNDKVRVVTSDGLIQLTALRTGVLRLSSAEFEREIAAVDEKIGEMIRAHTDNFERISE